MGYLESGLDEMLSLLKNEKDFYTNIIDPTLKGELNTLKKRDGTTYFHRIPMKNEDGTIRYLRKAINRHPEVIRALAENAYARAALKLVENNFRQIKTAQARIMETTHGSILGSLKKAYKELPAEFYDRLGIEGIMEEYREWMKAPFVQSDYMPEGRKFDTGRGVRVRSKSEVMFVEKFYQYGVPFHYEEVMAVGENELAPDFTFPSRSGQKFYLEYCGMMDDFGYVDHFLWKRKLYEGIGITEWNNMIYVFDSNNNLDMNRVDSVIRTMILPRL